MKIFSPDLFQKLPEAVLFDTDNTLYQYDPAHEAAQLAVQKKVMTTFSLSKEEFQSGYLMARKEIKKRLGQTAASHSRLLYFQKMLEIMGLGSQVLLALDFEQTYWRTFLSQAVLFENLTELLDDLRVIGIPLAVVTDLTAQIQFRKIVYFNLDHYFDYIVTSEEAGYNKPHEAPFRIAIEKMQLKENACIWMVGDNLVNDIKGAKEKINAVTILKMHKGVKLSADSFQPDATFKHYSELRKLVSRLSSRIHPTHLRRIAHE